jgi:hypothetical protein
VVWQQGASELLVQTDRITLACAVGLLTVAVPVRCDQLDREAPLIVPFAVGTEERPAGLVMSTFARPSGPEGVVAVWAEAVTAFAWEAVVHLAEQLSAAVGTDKLGRKLVPGTIAAARDLLLVQPMARHDLVRERP